MISGRSRTIMKILDASEFSANFIQLKIFSRFLTDKIHQKFVQDIYSLKNFGRLSTKNFLLIIHRKCPLKFPADISTTNDQFKKIYNLFIYIPIHLMTVLIKSSTISIKYLTFSCLQQFLLSFQLSLLSLPFFKYVH